MTGRKPITAVGFDLFGVFKSWDKQQEENMVALVQTLRDNGIVVGLLSNVDANNEFFQAYHQLFVNFDRVLLSSDIGVAKPHVQAYYHLIAALGSDPAATIFVDDNAYNVDGANQAGLQGILFEDYDQLIRDLKKYGINSL